MRNWLLWRTMLVVHFAKGARSPSISAIMRLLVGYGAAIIFGRILAAPVSRAELPSNIPEPVGLCLSVGFGFLIGGLLMLTTQATQQSGKAMSFRSVAALLPLSRRQRWLLAVLPSMLVLGIVVAFGVWLVVATAQSMNLPNSTMLLGWIAGLASGHGLILLSRPHTLVVRGILFAATVAAVLWLFDTSITANNTYAQTYSPWLIIGLLTWPILGYWQQYGRLSVAMTSRSYSVQKSLIPKVIPSSWWFGLKLMRNGRTRSAFSLSLMLSGVIALSIFLRHKVVTDPYGLLTIGAILAATFACEVRGVMRRYIPPELVVTGSSRKVLRIQTVTTFIAGIVIGLPLLFSLHGQSSSSALFLAYFLVIQAAATLLGLATSTVLVPSSGETGTQFFAGILAISGLTLVPKLAGFSSLSYWAQLPCWLAVSVICLGTMHFIELIRRKNYGCA